MNEITVKVDASEFIAAVDRFIAALGSKAELITPPAPTWIGEPASAAPQYPQPVAPSVAPQYPGQVVFTPPMPTSVAPQYIPYPSVDPAPQYSQATSPCGYPPVVPAPQTPLPASAPTEVKAYTQEELSIAAVPLMDAGRAPELCDFLKRYGVQALTQLPKEHYAAFAAQIRAMGAKI